MAIEAPACCSVVRVDASEPRMLKGLEIRELVNRDFLGDFSMFQLTLPAGKSLPNVVHRATEEIVFVLEGSMTAFLDGEARELSAGDMVTIPRGAWHRFQTGEHACKALALFHPGLSIAPGEDIHSPPGVSLWD